MKQKTVSKSTASDRLVKNIRRKSRKIYSAEEKIRIVLDGLRGEMSIAELCRREGIAEPGLIWHTDRGSQYASDSHRAILKDHDIIQSMSRKGNCWDNAVAESFFHTLKTELVHHHKFENQEEAKKAIFEYIEVFYNQNRMHSANNYLSPKEYENLTKAA